MFHHIDTPDVVGTVRDLLTLPDATSVILSTPGHPEWDMPARTFVAVMTHGTAFIVSPTY